MKTGLQRLSKAINNRQINGTPPTMLRADWSVHVTRSMAVEAVSGRVLSKVIWMELCGGGGEGE